MAYRIEADPTFGDFRFVPVLLDLRKYFFFNPLTLAFRGMHYGRYWGNDKSQQLSPFYLGNETWIRGYSGNSFTPEECASGNMNGSCPVIDRLIGTRVGIVNAELRLPLFGNEQYGLFNFQYLPTELLTFVDAGVAWTKDEKPVWKFDRDSDERTPVISAGAGVRFNLLGYIVVQIFYAYPFQRPDKGGQFGFVIAPGW
jgi:outer membrane protein assembly factor BamA